MKAKETIQTIVAQGLAAALKREGFRKNQLSFVRRCGATAHFVQVQPSSWNQGARGAFYINGGIMFDDVRRHFGLAVPRLPKYDDCTFRVRLERLFPEAPVQWVVTETTPVPEMAMQLVHCVMAGFVNPLQGLDSLGRFEKTGWLAAIHWGLPAIHAYLLGRDDQAKNLVQAEAHFFQDRGLTVDGLLESYRFARLQC